MTYMGYETPEERAKRKKTSFRLEVARTAVGVATLLVSVCILILQLKYLT